MLLLVLPPPHPRAAGTRPQASSGGPATPIACPERSLGPFCRLGAPLPLRRGRRCRSCAAPKTARSTISQLDLPLALRSLFRVEMSAESDATTAKRQKTGTRRVVILATNDTHSQMEPDSDGLGGIARRATYLKAVRADSSPDNVLLLDAGDAFMGSLYFTFFHGEVELFTMAKLGYRAMAMGNHDFDRGGLPNLRAKIAAHAPELDILCANIRATGGGQADGFKDYAVYFLSGGTVRVCVLGLMGRDAWQVTASEYQDGLEWQEPLPCARRLMQKLRASDTADVYVCLSHTGVNRGDVELASEPLFDAIFSGHEHGDKLHVPGHEPHEWALIPNALANGLGGTMLQPGWYNGKHVARLEISVCGGGSASGGLQLGVAASDKIDESLKDDQDMVETVALYRSSFEAKVAEVVGSSNSSCITKPSAVIERHIGSKPGTSAPVRLLLPSAPCAAQ
eukprot:SAG31_NODE_810_length_11919_cov_4.480924_15_plen_453_part_00